MSLNWNIQKCDPLAKSPGNWETTDSFIWATMAVDIGELNAKTMPEWKARLAMWRRTSEPRGLFAMLLDLPEAEWKMRFGLSTNVTTTTRAAFKRKLADFVEREALAELRRETAKKEGA
jgi:hypothetical protein